MHAEVILHGGAYSTEYKGKQTKIEDLPESYINKVRKDLGKWKPYKYKEQSK